MAKTKRPITPSVKKFVNIFDAHCGFEKRHVGKDYRVFPTHNPQAIAGALEFIKDFKPDVVTLGGDSLNFAPISHWNKTHFWANEGSRVKKEMDVLSELVLEPLYNIVPKSERVWHVGNHCAFLYAWINENPALQGLVEPENYLKLPENRWKIIEQGGMSYLGKLGIIHGDTLGKTSTPARKAAMMYGRNVRFGHFHSYDAFTMYNPVDAKDIKTSILVPALAARNQSYGKGAPNWCLNGFNFGYVWPDGRYTDYTIIMADSKFVSPDGKKYDGHELARKYKAAA